jgi:hypothetical protein
MSPSPKRVTGKYRTGEVLQWMETAQDNKVVFERIGWQGIGDFLLL